jgi:MinD superfamily P-loop ATPase
LQPKSSTINEFWGGSLAKIDVEKCTECGDCVPVCRYDAVIQTKIADNIYSIDPLACDGCAACYYVCRSEAVSMVPQQEGVWFHSETDYCTLFHAELFPGGENSGKLVTSIRQQARLRAEDENISAIIVDGPPGIGCPVISACAGADLALIVTEPGMAGLHDMERVLGTLKHFNIPVKICINKSNIYPDGTNKIKEYCKIHGYEVVGEIPYDENFPIAISNGVPFTSLYPDSQTSKVISQIWEKTKELLFSPEV